MRSVELIEFMCGQLLRLQEASGRRKGEFAESVGLTPQQLTNISNYRNPPAPTVIAEAWRVYGVPADFFYFGALAGIADRDLAERLRILSSPVSVGSSPAGGPQPPGQRRRKGVPAQG
jgi:hypothetical protein